MFHWTSGRAALAAAISSSLVAFTACSSGGGGTPSSGDETPPTLGSGHGPDQRIYDVTEFVTGLTLRGNSFAFDGSGYLFVGQNIGVDQILKYDSNGKQVDVLSVPKYPRSLATDAAGNLYMGWRNLDGAGVLRSTFKDGKYSAFESFDSGTTLCNPTALAVDANNSLYVADTYYQSSCVNDAVHRYGADGAYIEDVTNGIDASALAMGSGNTVFIADRGSNKILKAVAKDGGGYDISRFDSGVALCDLAALAADSGGNLYVLDMSGLPDTCVSNVVRKLNGSGEYVQDVASVTIDIQSNNDGNLLAVGPKGAIFFPWLDTSQGFGGDKVMKATARTYDCDDPPKCNNSRKWDECRTPEGVEYVYMSVDAGEYRYRCQGIGPMNNCFWAVDPHKDCRIWGVPCECPE